MYLIRAYYYKYFAKLMLKILVRQEKSKLIPYTIKPGHRIFSLMAHTHSCIKINIRILRYIAKNLSLMKQKYFCNTQLLLV